MPHKNSNQNITHKTFPKGVLSLFSANILVNFTMSMFFAMLVRYVVSQLGYTDAHASDLFGAFASLLFGGAILGGYLASFISVYRLMKASAILCVLSGIFAAFQTKTLFYMGMACMVMGYAIYSPSTNFFLGQLYDAKNLKRSSGFTLGYMGVNLGSTIAAFSGGFIALKTGSYKIDFLLGSLSSFLGFFVFFKQHKKFNFRKNYDKKRCYTDLNPKKCNIIIFGVCITLVIIFSLLLDHALLSNIILITLGIVSLIYFLIKAFQPSNIKYRTGMFILIILISISIFFWTLYMTSPSILTEFIVHHVNKNILGLNLPSSAFWGFGPLFIILLGSVFAWVWKVLAEHNKNPSDFIKFALAILFIGAAYTLLSIKIGTLNIHNTHNTHNIPQKLSGYWIILSYFLQTCGELLIGPIGFAMIGKYSPQKYEPAFLGLWQLAIGLGASLAGVYGQNFKVPEKLNFSASNILYQHAFSKLSALALSLGFLIILLYFSFKIFRQIKNKK